MNRPLPTLLCRWLLPALLLLAAQRCRAQNAYAEEPRWLRFRVNEVSLGAEVEGLKEDISVNGASPSTHKYGFVTPLLGLRFNGSVYHPNLMTFDFNGEGGMGWAEDTLTSPGSSLIRHENQNLLRYVASANFLSGKPYNASFYASQDHNYNNYDFFNTATVDSLRYGGRVAWSAKSFNLGVDTGYREQTASGLSGISEISDLYLNFNGLHQRERGSSTLTYNYDDYSNRLDYGPTQNGVTHSIGASDTETFGQRGQITATAGVGYSRADYTSQQTETFNANANVTVKHRLNLESFYNLTYDDNQQSPATTSLLQGMAGIRHQLYESLSSTLDVHGTYDRLSSPTGSGKNDLYGVGVREDYTKRLTSWGRLSLGGTVVFDHQDHDSTGSILSVINEPHVISDSVPTFLNNPRVIQSTIVVTGPGGFPTYVRGSDYQVITSGELTQLLRNPTSLDLPNNSSILVSYQSESLYTSSYESMNGGLQIRLDVLDRFGIYGRLNVVDNNAPPEALAETLTDWVGGVDATWRWLRAGMEYEDFDSSFTQYRATRLFETFTFQPGEGSNLGLDFNQIWYRYPSSPQETQYRFMARFDTQLTSWLWWNVEGGYYLREAMNVQQDLAAARTGLNLAWGKLTVRAGYQYNYELTQQTERRDRNYFYLHLRRVF